jgi:hypothetical protein
MGRPSGHGVHDKHSETGSATWAYFLDERTQPDRRYRFAGLLVTLVLHGFYVGTLFYDYYQDLQRWKVLMGLQLVNRPGSITLLSPADIARLTAPLYYPPGLVSSSAAREDAQRRDQQRRRREHARRRAKEAEDEATKPIPQSWEELEKQARETATQLNIGPIKEAIAQLYEARMRGELAFTELRVGVSFRVKKDGELTDIQLAEPSGIAEVDSAAIMVINEASRVRVLAPLAVADSCTVRLVISDAAQLYFIAASRSETGASELLAQLNGLLLLVRLNAGQLDPDVASVIARLTIIQEGRNVVASVKIPRSEAAEMLKNRLGAKS